MQGKWLGKLTGWLDLLLESRCALCDRSAAQELCQDCQVRLQQCQVVNREAFGQTSLSVFAWGIYEGALKQSIRVLKYNNQPQLARPLGYWMGQAWLSSPVSHQARSLKAVTVVPIPMHPDKQQQRGFNQAELIGRSFCERTGLQLQAQGLVRVRATASQFSLSPEARAQNLSGAFQVGEGLKRGTTRPVLLVDDIYTTGATAKAAAQALHQHQIPVCGLVAVARAAGMQS